MKRAVVSLVVDPTVRLVVLSRLITLLSAPVTLYLIAVTRSPVEQGFYFVFANVLAIAALFEFGVGTMMVQFVSHAATDIVWESSRIAGEEAALRVLWRVLNDAERWFLLIAVALTTVLIPGGILFFRSEAVRTGTDYFMPWLILVASLTLYLVVVPALCALEGCGQINRVQRMRVAQAVATSAVLWLGIPTVGSLVAVALAGLAQLLIAVAWLVTTFPGFLRQYFRAVLERAPGVVADRSLMRAQTHTGVYWLVGFLGPQALAPLLFAFQGSPAAGKMGLSLALASAPLTLGLSWLQARYPTFGAHAARNDRAQLDDIALHATMQALFVCACGEIAIVAFVRVLESQLPDLAHRVLPVPGMVALGVATLGTLLFQAMAAYLRAHREEALLWPLVVGTLVAIGASAGAAHSGPTITAYAYAASIVLVLLPLSVVVFSRRRRTLA